MLTPPFASSPIRCAVAAWTLALPCAVTFAQVAGSDTAAAAGATLSTVVVTDVRATGLRPETVEAGTFRGADIMDVPSTVNVVTREALDLQAAEGVYDAVRNTAGVTRQQNGGDTWDQLVIRGITVENRTNYRINGSLTYLNFGQMALENKERVEVLKGASALYYGFTAPSGVVNFVTKRAGSESVTSLGMSVNSNGGALATADIGRRFGDESQFGLRVNAAGGEPGSYLQGASDGSRQFLSAAFDWRVNSRVKISADIERDRRRQIEQGSVTLPTAVAGVITLPRAVDPTRSIGPTWSTLQTESTHALLRADIAVSDNWALTLEAGRSEVERLRQLAIFRFTSPATVATGAGTLTGNSQNLDLRSDMLRAELAGSVGLLGMRHELTLGVTQTTKDQAPIYQRTYSAGAQNLYDPRDVSNTVTFGAVPLVPTTAAYTTRDNGLYAIDRVVINPQWQLIGGLRYTSYDSNQGGVSYSPEKTTPMAAVVYRPLDALSIYASFAQALEEGETAPTGSANVGTRLSPGVSDQKELGARWLAPTGTLFSAAVFDITRPGYYTDVATNIFTGAGEQRYTGAELSAQGQLTRALGWQASTLWLDARFAGIGAAYDGKLPENTARRTASAFLSYDIPGVSGLSVNGGAFYTGRRPVNDLNQAFLGGVTLLAAGVRYVDKVFGKRTTWQLNVENLADKQYWAAGGTRLAAGAPRTFKATVRVDL